MGLTRDSLVFLWGKLVGAAVLVTSGVFDPGFGLIDPASIGLSPKMVHIIQAVAILVLYLSGQLSTSALPGKNDASKVDLAKLGRGAGVGLLLLVLWPVAAQAQPLAIDRLTPSLPTASERRAADLVSWATVIAAVALDAKATWEGPCGGGPPNGTWDHCEPALVKSALRVGAIYGSVFLVKAIVHRQRPCAPIDCGVDNPDFSFYSAHTALAFSTLGGPRLAVSLPLAVSTGGLRIAAGKHYLSDVVVGALVGAAAGHWIR